MLMKAYESRLMLVDVGCVVLLFTFRPQKFRLAEKFPALQDVASSLKVDGEGLGTVPLVDHFGLKVVRDVLKPPVHR